MTLMCSQKLYKDRKIATWRTIKTKMKTFCWEGMELTEKIAVKCQSRKLYSHNQSDLPHGHHEDMTPPFVSTILVIVLFPNQPQRDSVKMKATCSFFTQIASF